MSSIRFSPNPNRADRIEWLPWTPSTFERAQAEDKPVLLSVSAAWCYWCHVMDETTYSDPDVQSLLADGFLAVRVDNDHRPDINSRYNVGGWPTTAFLTPHGGLIGGATYLPADQFLAMLMELKHAYEADKPQIYSQSRDLLRQRREHARRVSAGPEVEISLVDRVSRIVAGAYDAIEGGFGSEPKFPNPSILRFTSHLYRTKGEEFYGAMLRKSLDRMATSPMFDPVEGGFFRYSSSADWSGPQREKLLDDNVQLARVFLDASILCNEPAYRETAERTITFVLERLFDPEAMGFSGSQGAHSDYFALSAGERKQANPPAADPSCYSGPGAVAAAILLDASWKLGRPDLAEAALPVLDRVDDLARSGQFCHAYGESGVAGGPALLADWAGLLTGLMQAHFSTGESRYLERGAEVARKMIDGFFDEEGGGFFDIEADEDAVGHMQVREKQLPENMAAVQALLRLHNATRNDDYRQICEATLSAFASVFREHGEFAADFGLAVDLFLNSLVEVTVEGQPEDPACRKMVDAAARLKSPNLDIKTVLSQAPVLAHVCLDTLCLPPVNTPEGLVEAASGLDSQASSPFQDIFSIFPGA